MLFFIGLIIFILSLFVSFKWFNNFTGVWNNGFIEVLGVISSIIVGIFVMISIVVIPINHFGTEAQISTCQQRYEILNYQAKNNMYDNDNEYGKKELMIQVQNWNEDLAYRKEIQDNFWVGIYFPNIYDQFEFIDYTNVK